SKNLTSAIKNIDKYEYVLTSEYEELMMLNKEKIKDIRFELRSNADIGYEKDVLRAKQREYNRMLKSGKITLSNEIICLKSLYDDYENKAEGIRIAILSKLEQVEKYMRTEYKKPAFKVSDSVKEKSEYGEKIRKKELLKRERRFKHLEMELSREIKPFPSQDIVEIQNAIKSVKEPIDNIGLKVPDEIRRINQKIIEARDSLLSTDLDSAKNIYLEILSIYNELPDERKLKVYEAIKELYDERKSAEKVLGEAYITIFYWGFY
ncbi:MAG: hypothetical protein AABY14_00520, partial [Nanoarchaeota archaeon]